MSQKGQTAVIPLIQSTPTSHDVVIAVNLLTLRGNYLPQHSYYVVFIQNRQEQAVLLKLYV